MAGSWQDRPKTPGPENRQKSLTDLRGVDPAKGQTRWPGPSSPLLRQPWRPLESVINNHPELLNCFRERQTRGGKLFPRTQIIGAVRATVVVVAPTATTGSATRRKQPRSFGREGKAPQLGRRHLPRSQAAPLTSGQSSLGRRGAWRSRFPLPWVLQGELGAGARAHGRALQPRPARSRQADWSLATPAARSGRCLLRGLRALGHPRLPFP